MDSVSNTRRLRPALGSSREVGASDARTESAETLFRKVLADVDVVTKVAAKSANLKGTFVKALKDAAGSIASSVEELATRTESREIGILRVENQRLRMNILRRVFRVSKRDGGVEGAEALSLPLPGSVPAAPCE